MVSVSVVPLLPERWRTGWEMLGFFEASQDFLVQRNGHCRVNGHYFLSHVWDKILPPQAWDSEEKSKLSQVWYNVTGTWGFLSKQTSQGNHACTLIIIPGKPRSLNHSAHAWNEQELICSLLCLCLSLELSSRSVVTASRCSDSFRTLATIFLLASHMKFWREAVPHPHLYLDAHYVN